MTKAELEKRLRRLIAPSKKDAEYAHALADKLLLEYVGDAKVTDAFERIDKWYS